ncbi:MAG: metal ABC transporter substrate-binding protein [Oscillospiraceae bacterium]|jgi:zinc transport system substrate-binding protein|nr:metal ABC transporter substrate-binding protein [Oscillospiraceae bacterium]
MKKFISIALALLIGALALSGCANNNTPNDSENDKGLSVVTTIFPPYDFAREIAGDKAEVTMLLPPASESHSFDPTPADIIKIQDCDVFIYVGGESDEWVSSILESMDTSNMRIITLMDCVEVVEEEIVEGMEDDEHEEGEEGEEGGEEAEEPEYDEHVWTSPRNAKLIVEKISETLREVDADNADYYRANTEAYSAELDDLDAKFKAVVDSAARNTLVFGDRFPFRYFADAYGLDYYAAFPGCSTETEASAATIAFLIDKVKDEQIPVVFHIELSNEKIADAISESTGAKVALLHACHNISKNDFESGKSYLDLMTDNVEALREALN